MLEGQIEIYPEGKGIWVKACSISKDFFSNIMKLMSGVSKTKNTQVLYVWPETTWTAGETKKYVRIIVRMATPTRKYQKSTDKHKRLIINVCYA